MKFYLSGGWDACKSKREKERRREEDGGRGWKIERKKERERGNKRDGKEAGAEGTERRMENGRICPYDGARFAARKDFESKIDYHEVM